MNQGLQGIGQDRTLMRRKINEATLTPMTRTHHTHNHGRNAEETAHALSADDRRRRPEVLEVIDISEPRITSPTQIRVRLRGAGVNPIDTKIRSCNLFCDAEPPAMLGCDLSGEVIETDSRVDRSTIDDRVGFGHDRLGHGPGNYTWHKMLEQAEAETHAEIVRFPPRCRWSANTDHRLGGTVRSGTPTHPAGPFHGKLMLDPAT